MIHPPILCVGGGMEGGGMEGGGMEGGGARGNWVVLLVILWLHNFSECQGYSQQLHF